MISRREGRWLAQTNRITYEHQLSMEMWSNRWKAWADRCHFYRSKINAQFELHRWMIDFLLLERFGYERYHRRMYIALSLGYVAFLWCKRVEHRFALWQFSPARHDTMCLCAHSTGRLSRIACYKASIRWAIENNRQCFGIESIQPRGRPEFLMNFVKFHRVSDWKRGNERFVITRIEFGADNDVVRARI